MAADTTPSYFRYFDGTAPANYRWSSAANGLLTYACAGGAGMGEVHLVLQHLRDRVGDDEAWFDSWRRFSDQLRERAQAQEAEGRRLAASKTYLRACCYFQMGERFRVPKDEAALDVYRTSVECFHRFAELTDGPRIEVVEVPFEDTSLPGYFVHPQGTPASPAQAVVFFDGLDITKELQFARAATEIVRRGVACLVLDGPGTGEAIRFRGQTLRADYEVAGTAALEYLAARPDVDADRIGIMAISLGGYYAPRCAAREPRCAGCIAWGAIWDYHATWKRRIESAFQTSMSVAGDHITWILGVDTLDEALQKLEGFQLEGVVDAMRCPFLLVHGEDDRQISLEDAQKLYDAVGSQDKTMRVYTAEEGGSQHCQSDYPTMVVDDMSDWLAEKL